MCKRFLCWILFVGVSLSFIDAQGAPAASNAPAAATNSPLTANTNAIALPEIASQAESASAALHSMSAEMSADKTTQAVQQNLPVITDEITSRLEENSRVLSRSPSLELLSRLSSEWLDIREELSGWKRGLTRRATQIEADLKRLAQLENTWAATRDAITQSNAPPELGQKVDDVIGDIRSTRQKVEAQLALVLTLQNRVGEQDSRIAQSLSAIEQAREEMVGHLLVRDSAPIWSLELGTNTGENLARQSHHSLSRQFKALEAYTQRKTERFICHGIILLALVAVIIFARRKLRQRCDADSNLRHAMLVFETPIATALVLSLVASSWIYPQAPRMLWAILGAAALIPATIVLRRLIERRLFPALTVLVAFYFLDQLRSITAAPELLSRSLFLLEMLAGGVFVIWFNRSGRFIATEEPARWRKIVRFGIVITGVLLAAAFIANVLGYGALSKLLGNATLTCCYLALILYAAIRIADGLILSALSVAPLGRVEMVKRHRMFLQDRMRQVLEWAAIVLWVIYALEAFSVRAPLFQDLRELLMARLTLGSLSISLGDVLLFGVAIWIAFMVSRIVRFILEEEVYPHIQLAPGLYYSISRMVHYAILLAGFFTGIALLGFNLTRLTVLVGAVGVGLGFGLQNIINNFVSGIILLFERPVKVGDVIQIESAEGVVTHIGIRASIVRTTSGPEIIVPNAKLISDPVTNWTFSRRRRMITIPITTVPGVEAQKVLAILKSAADGTKTILPEPVPQALFIGFANGGLNFELRVWTDRVTDWMQIRSELSAAINTALIGQNISIK